ncbi:putative ADP-ribosylation factor GTPase activating protein [Leishmania major strain Friedlin]|uniref:Putative ADP-ribosylation factor GTPase activating protein n=1 Tax=Leishmania major TaxID=5664 RepID=Q4Q1A4_LEIMA|nr:putative ADP-ribosylation factor GTPase activating protein [Leishmania major strain Friedlin]CAG9583851.1 ADP-ribosylation_factor_GTPase_activating_protein_-_putative [Leishmania major strain Friedlin]CAJ09277.1 putative ADP-ribosylation factor GTPase activating protein [Leishmania major strain Friedlin]|eukprot:XP_001686894.1 putative ADP-ribosylation factor GTPase activating protein [Leishmania major strain Friedlin]
MNIRQRKSERHKEVLRKLSQNGGNKNCFDCGMRGPLYVVSDFGILVCSGCSAVHRSFQHKVKGITMSEFTDDEIARFSVSGNDRARKVWLSTFHDQLPRSGNVMALKDHVHVVFEERRFWSAQELSALQDSWEHAQGQPSHAPPSLSVTRPAESPLASVPEAPTAQPGPAAAPTSPVRPPQEDAFDNLFSAPVQPSSTPQPTAHAAAPPLPPMTTSHAPTPPAPQQPATVTSIVADLFAGVPPPVVQPAGGYSAPHPQQQQQKQSMGYPTDGGMYNFTQDPQSSMMAPTQLQSSQLPSQQQQPQPFTWGQPVPAQLQQQQQQQHMIGLLGSSGTVAPYATPAQSQSYNFKNGAPGAAAYPSANGAPAQAYQPSPFASNPPPPQEGGGASFIPNHNRIVVLSVTKQQNDGPQNPQPQWQ